MKIKTWIKYEESYVPPRCRKPRYIEKEEYVFVNLKELTADKLQLAFEDNSYEGKGKIYLYNNKLWCKAAPVNTPYYDDINERWKTSITTYLDYIIWSFEHSSQFFRFGFDREKYGVDTSKEAVIKLAKNYIDNYILVNGEVYEKTEEPRYVIVTFGLGHNHGGTGMFCEYHYNPNISNESYFNAVEGDKAVQYANATAAARGDTRDIGKFKPFITCYRPDIIKVKPKKQHDSGNSLLNSFEKCIKCSSNPLDAGLLCIGLASAADEN